MSNNIPDLSTVRIGILGLGYVGLPLAVEFGKQFPTIGFDVDSGRIQELGAGHDRSMEVESEDLRTATQLTYTHLLDDLKPCNFYIVTVPTPINEYKQPDFGYLESASKMLGNLMQPGNIAVFESTVYPGATEEVCVPLIEQVSGLRYNQDFFIGYSPERINPGDKHHRLPTILKVTSGSTPEVADLVDTLYRRIITAGTHKASSIRVAEAAKVIENTQRDLNIAFINELAILFHLLGIDTQEVLEAAGTKWNFLPFRPGLVGGHCIGVDPYYLTHKAQAVGHHPQVILAGRRVNDQMGSYVASRVLKLLIQQHQVDKTTRVLVLGLTFKENCPDLRNSRVVDVIRDLESYGISVDVYDPWADHAEAKHEYGISLISEPQAGTYNAVILAVAHREFVAAGSQWARGLGVTNAVLFDVKQVFPATEVDGRL